MIEASERTMNQSAVILLRNPFQPSQREVIVAHHAQHQRRAVGHAEPLPPASK